MRGAPPVQGRSCNQTRNEALHALEKWAKQTDFIPMRRIGEPVDIAAGVAFLARDESRFMNGQTLHGNGGLVLP